MTAAKELNFEDFRRQCGLPEWRVRAALRALGYEPRPEGRRLWYQTAWIDDVRQWDKAHMGQ